MNARPQTTSENTGNPRLTTRRDSLAHFKLHLFYHRIRILQSEAFWGVCWKRFPQSRGRGRMAVSTQRGPVGGLQMLMPTLRTRPRKSGEADTLGPHNQDGPRCAHCGVWALPPDCLKPSLRSVFWIAGRNLRAPARPRTLPLQVTVVQGLAPGTKL